MDSNPSENEDQSNKTNGQFKLSINSKLIRSNSFLPDELKELGVCAYNEHEFEKGILDQVGLQISDYEQYSYQASDDIDNDQVKKSNATKRKSASTAEIDGHEKRSKNETDNFSSLFNQESNSSHCDEISYSPLMDEDNLSETERLIKAGDMTPFGTVAKVGKLTSNKPSSNQKAAKATKLDSKTSTNDFDSFLLEFDKKPKQATKKPLRTAQIKPIIVN